MRSLATGRVQHYQRQQQRVNIKQFYMNTATLLQPLYQIAQAACNVSTVVTREDIAAATQHLGTRCRSAACVVVQQAASKRSERHRRWGDECTSGYQHSLYVGYFHPLNPDSALLSSVLTVAVMRMLPSLRYVCTARITVVDYHS